MTVTHHDGSGTCRATSGIQSTSVPEPTSSLAPVVVTAPAAEARAGDQAAVATTASPACGTSAIAATANRLSSAPAKITRPNSVAETGSSTSSVATDAYTTAAAGPKPRDHSCHDIRRGVSPMIAPVAPTVSK